MELEIPVLVLDPVRVLGEVEVDIECLTTDRESLRDARCMLKEEWDLKKAHGITLLSLGKKLKIEFGDRQ